MDAGSYTIAGNEIHFGSGKVARFAYPVVDALPFGDHLVVLIWPPLGTVYNENVFGVDSVGNTVWQIERLYPCNVDAAYCGVHDDEGYAVIGNIKDLVLYLDPATGKIVKRFWQTQEGFKPIPPEESVA